MALKLLYNLHEILPEIKWHRTFNLITRNIEGLGHTKFTVPLRTVIKSVLCHGMREFRDLSDTIYRDVIENSSLVKADVNTRDSLETFYSVCKLLPHRSLVTNIT